MTTRLSSEYCAVIIWKTYDGVMLYRNMIGYYMRSLGPDTGIWSMGKYLHSTDHCGILLVISILNTCYWHPSLHIWYWFYVWYPFSSHCRPRNNSTFVEHNKMEHKYQPVRWMKKILFYIMLSTQTGHATLVRVIETTTLVPYFKVSLLQLMWKWDTYRFHLWMSDLLMSDIDFTLGGYLDSSPSIIAAGRHILLTFRVRRYWNWMYIYIYIYIYIYAICLSIPGGSWKRKYDRLSFEKAACQEDLGMTHSIAKHDTFDDMHGLTHCPWQILMGFQKSNFQARCSDWWLRHLLCNCPEMNVAGFDWW